MTSVDIFNLATAAFACHRSMGSKFWGEISQAERDGWIKATEYIVRATKERASAPSTGKPVPESSKSSLKEGTRVALAMRRGVVTRVTGDGFWIQLDGKPAHVKTWIGFGEPWLEERFEQPTPETLFARIERAINATSSENGSNTPDFILAEYLTDCLAAFDKAVKARIEWYGSRGGAR